jgi:uncharacterized MAPEG superfamily protein
MMEKLPFWMLLAALGLIYVPRFLVIVAQSKRPEGFDNRHPRVQQAKLEGFGSRAQGAHMNGFESFSPFAVGVVICLLTHADATRVAYLSVAFVVLRAYIVFYLLDKAPLRSLTWFAGFGVIVALMFQPLLVS